MVNTKNTKNTLSYIISFFFFIIMFISFFLLIKNGGYENYTIFVLVASSFLFGYSIRKRNDNIEEENLGEDEEEKKEAAILLGIKKVPQEFLDEQERYKKLSLENKGEEKTGQ